MPVNWIILRECNSLRMRITIQGNSSLIFSSPSQSSKRTLLSIKRNSASVTVWLHQVPSIASHTELGSGLSKKTGRQAECQAICSNISRRQPRAYGKPATHGHHDPTRYIALRHDEMTTSHQWCASCQEETIKATTRQGNNHNISQLTKCKNISLYFILRLISRSQKNSLNLCPKVSIRWRNYIMIPYCSGWSQWMHFSCKHFSDLPPTRTKEHKIRISVAKYCTIAQLCAIQAALRLTVMSFSPLMRF